METTQSKVAVRVNYITGSNDNDLSTLYFATYTLAEEWRRDKSGTFNDAWQKVPDGAKVIESLDELIPELR